MPPRWQPSLDDYIDIAAYLLGADRAAVAALPRITLAESALHAPFASFGGTEAYPALVEQAAVLLEHLAKNHPLPDANKRAAFLLTARFLDANGLQWGPPDVETDAGLVERVAASEATHDEVVAWIRGRTREMECPDERQRGLVVCRNAGETDAKSGKARTPATSPEPTESPANAADSGARAAI